MPSVTLLLMRCGLFLLLETLLQSCANGSKKCFFLQCSFSEKGNFSSSSNIPDVFTEDKMVVLYWIVYRQVIGWQVEHWWTLCSHPVGFETTKRIQATLTRRNTDEQHQKKKKKSSDPTRQGPSSSRQNMPDLFYIKSKRSSRSSYTILYPDRSLAASVNSSPVTARHGAHAG